MGKKTTESPVSKPASQGFNFPEYSITIQAESIEEAQEKLQKILNNKDARSED